MLLRVERKSGRRGWSEVVKILVLLEWREMWENAIGEAGTAMKGWILGTTCLASVLRSGRLEPCYAAARVVMVRGGSDAALSAASLIVPIM